jgi:hypothetical protein
MNASARTTSSVVTPNRRAGLYVPAQRGGGGGAAAAGGAWVRPCRCQRLAGPAAAAAPNHPAKQPNAPRRVRTRALEDLRRDGHGAVDGVADDQHPGVGAVARDALGGWERAGWGCRSKGWGRVVCSGGGGGYVQMAAAGGAGRLHAGRCGEPPGLRPHLRQGGHNAGVDVEQVVARHPGLAGDAWVGWSGERGAGSGAAGARGRAGLAAGRARCSGRGRCRRPPRQMQQYSNRPPQPPRSRAPRPPRRRRRRRRRTRGDYDQLAARERVAEPRRPRVAAHAHGRADVGQVGGDAGGVGNVVQQELADERRRLEQQRERLADAAGGAEHGDLGLRTVAGGVGVRFRAAWGAAGGPRGRWGYGGEEPGIPPWCCRRSRAAGAPPGA